MSNLDNLFTDPSLPRTVDNLDQMRFKFDEDGFKKATDIATLRARQEMQEKIRSLNDDFMAINHPNDFNVTIDGVPIDKSVIENGATKRQ